MPDENPNLDIRATLDSSGVKAGANVATGAIGTVSAATAEATKVAELYGVSLANAERALAILSVPIGEATANLAELDAAMDLAQQETIAASAANRAYAASLTESAAAVIAQGEAEETLGGLTAATTRQLALLKIEQSAVAATAAEMGLSLQIAAQAMIQIEKARIAATVTEARAAMEGLTVATTEEAAAAEVAADANELDATALAQRAIMMRRTSDGLVDLAMGGRRALQGVADLQFVLTKMFPGGAVTLGILGGIAIVAELWESAQRKMEREHSKTTEKIVNNIGSIVKVYEESTAEILGLQSDLEKADDRRISRLTEALRLEKEHLSVARDAADAELESEALAKEQGETEDQRRQTERELRRKENEAAGQDKVDAAQDELETKKQVSDATSQKLKDDQASISDDREMLQAKKDAAKYAHDLLTSQGINLNSQGELDKGATAPLEKALADAHSVLEAAKERMREGYARGLSGDALQAEKDRRYRAVGSAETAVQNAEEKLAETRMAPAIIKASEEAQKTLTESIKKRSQEIEDENQKLSDQQKEIADAQTALATATRQLANIRQRDAQEAQSDQGAADKKIETREDSQAYGTALDADKQTLQGARDALSQAQESARQVVEHARAMGETGKAHAEQMARLAQSTAATLQGYKDRVQQAEEAIRKLEQQHQQAKNNAL